MGEHETPGRLVGRSSWLGEAVTERTWIGGITVVILAATVTVIAGPIGAVTGLVTVTIWYGLGTPYAIATAVVLLVGIFPDGTSTDSFVIVTASMVLLVLSVAAGTRRWIRTGTVTLVSTAVLGGFAWGALTDWSLWIAVSGTLVVFALLSYGLHRYELVRLGLVSDENVRGTRSDGGRGIDRPNEPAEVSRRER